MARSVAVEALDPTEVETRAARKAREALSRALAAGGAGGVVRLEAVELPLSVARALERIIAEFADGRAVAVRSLDDEEAEVTSSEAARMLGMSRPTLIGLLDRGELPYRLVGTHRRLPLGAVLDYKARSAAAVRVARREERLRGLEEMAETTDRLGLGY